MAQIKLVCSYLLWQTMAIALVCLVGVYTVSLFLDIAVSRAVLWLFINHYERGNVRFLLVPDASLKGR